MSRLSGHTHNIIILFPKDASVNNTKNIDYDSHRAINFNSKIQRSVVKCTLPSITLGFSLPLSYKHVPLVKDRMAILHVCKVDALFHSFKFMYIAVNFYSRQSHIDWCVLIRYTRANIR